MRTLNLVLMGIGMVLCGASAGAQAEKEIRLDIQTQVLVDALNEWAQAAGFRLIGPGAATRHLSSPRLQGTFTARGALDRLLDGTSLTYEFIDDGTVAIRERLPTSVAAPSSAAGMQVDSHSLRLAAAQVDEARRSSDAAEPENRATPSVNARESDSSDRKHLRAALEEVIVTAQKREQALIDVPISITAISGERLEQSHINNIQELSFVVPSMSTAEIGAGRQLITLRGMGGTRGQSSLTGIYLDEMPVSGMQDGFIATYSNVGTTDLERVEVLKGPQGTLFGEGSVGGTVRFITNDPDLSSVGGNVSASMFSNTGSDGSLSGDVSGVLNMPVVEDKFGLRIAATYENQAGWIDKLRTVNGPVLEEDFNDQELMNIRVKGLWKPTENLAVKAMAVVHRSEGGGSNIVNLEPRENHHFIIEFEPTAHTGYTDDYELYNLTTTYDFGFAQLLSSTSYSDKNSVASLMQRKPLIPAPNPGFQELLAREYLLDASSFSQELRFSSTGSEPLSWTVGAYYNDSDVARHNLSGFDFVRFGQVVNRGANANLRSTFTSESWAAFGDVSYALTPRLEIGVGARYFEDQREAFDAFNVSSTFLSGGFDATTFRSYVSYAIADDIKAYGSVSTGFRSGGFNTTSVVVRGGPATFDPETVTSYELGTKMALNDGRVDVKAALFYSEYTDIQMNSIFLAGDGFPLAVTGNPGEAKLTGFEVELNWAATDRLTLGLSGDVIDTELTKVDTRVQPAPFVVGDPIDLVPDYSVAARVDYEVHWSPSVPGHVRLQYSEQGQTTNALRSLGALEPITYTPVLNFLSASIGASWNGWEFELFGRNLLDEAGALRTGGGIDPQARPRAIGVGFDRSF